MPANLPLILGPVLALAVARAFGPLAVWPALAIAALGQVLGMGTLVLWRRTHVVRVPTDGTLQRPIAVIPAAPTRAPWASVLTAWAALLGIAATVAGVALLLQVLWMRGLHG